MYVCVPMGWAVGCFCCRYNFANQMNLEQTGTRLDSDGVKLFCAPMGKRVADNAIQARRRFVGRRCRRRRQHLPLLAAADAATAFYCVSGSSSSCDAAGSEATNPPQSQLNGRFLIPVWSVYQVLGGNGYVGEYNVERLWRDAKLLEIGGGTNEAHHKNMTRDILARGLLP
jgi:alkylation response protein AidB-like acyl-CoA dehydrogenase